MKKIIIITGGTSGLGKELVKESINRGYYVCNLARNVEKMKALDLEFKDNYMGFVGDITDEEFVIESINEINKLGNIDTLINCAEKGYFKKVTDYNSWEVDSSLSGLKGMILCTKETLKLRKKKI